MRIRLDSIGCRLNIGEMEALARQLAAHGHRIVGPGDATDLFVFNTCAVTHVASRKSRKVLRQIRRQHPDAGVVATGCYADLSPGEVAELGVDLVVANRDKDQLAKILADRGMLRDADPVPNDEDGQFAGVPGSRTRAFVKVQDGCDNRCSFCIITVARGASRSRPQAEIIEEVRQLAASGYQEAVLSGVHLGSYGHDAGDPDGLEGLVLALLEQTEVQRLRLSSLEPWDLAPRFFDLWRDPRLLPHLHLPIQSGCDQTLVRMCRNTTQQQFSELLTAARQAIPGVAISTDVIVGFPGEDDAEFEESIDYVRASGFSRLHVFRYSRRDGTAAERMPGQVDESAMQERSSRMHRLAAELENGFRERLIGSTMPILWESSEPFGNGQRWSGLTGNYIRVVTETGADDDLYNRVVPAELVACMPGALYGVTQYSRREVPEPAGDVIAAARGLV
jgi:threonylcarbamoyladenosine tRNA methylthiotransferase MtaB